MALNMETPMSFLHFYTILRIDKDLKLRKLGGCIKTLAITLTITEVTCFAIITYKLDDYQNIYYCTGKQIRYTCIHNSNYSPHDADGRKVKI